MCTVLAFLPGIKIKEPWLSVSGHPICDVYHVSCDSQSMIHLYGSSTDLPWFREQACWQVDNVEISKINWFLNIRQPFYFLVTDWLLQDEDEVVSGEVMANHIQRLINLLQFDGDANPVESQSYLEKCLSLHDLEGHAFNKGEDWGISSPDLYHEAWDPSYHFTAL